MADPTPAVVTLDEVRAHLNYDAGDTDDDAELQRFAVAATEVAEEIGGLVRQQSGLVEQHDGGSATIVLLEPVVTVQSIVEYLAQVAYPLVQEPLGGATSFYGYTIDGAAVTRRSFGLPVPFMPGRRNVIVTYTAGTAFLSEKVRLGVLELIRHWWQQGQQQSGGNTLRGAAYGYSDDAVQSAAKMGYAIPNRVVQLLSPDRRTPGIA